jgi:hypothetical protein
MRASGRRFCSETAGCSESATSPDRREPLDIKNTADLPEVEAGFMDIVELKRPDLEFWTRTKAGALYQYRGKYPIPSYELQGAIA